MDARMKPVIERFQQGLRGTWGLDEDDLNALFSKSFMIMKRILGNAQTEPVPTAMTVDCVANLVALGMILLEQDGLPEGTMFARLLAEQTCQQL